MKNTNIKVNKITLCSGKLCASKCCASCRYWDSSRKNSRGEGKCGYKNVHTSPSSYCNAYEN